MKSTNLKLDLTQEETQLLLTAANHPFKTMPFNQVVADVFGGDPERAARAFQVKKEIWKIMEEAENKDIEREAKMGKKAAVTQ